MTQEENTQDYAPGSFSHDRRNDRFPGEDENNDKQLEDELLNYLANSKATFKSQQKGEPDLSTDEKLTIARNLLYKSDCLFLAKFGRYLKEEHLKYFERSNNDYEVVYHLQRLHRYFNNSARRTDVRNRRYEALKSLIEQGEYFSESEMMKRNPLLYEQLVGQYMTEKQKNIRDNLDTENITFVNLLMENIERDALRKKQKLQEAEEQNAVEETETDDEEDIVVPEKQVSKCWGGMSDTEETETVEKEVPSISKSEKQILKQEFVSSMYQSFLDGKDADFDYSAVDENEAYDNIELRTQDEEEKYFDSESPETLCKGEENNESEDELDLYMRSLKVN